MYTSLYYRSNPQGYLVHRWTHKHLHTFVCISNLALFLSNQKKHIHVTLAPDKIDSTCMQYHCHKNNGLGFTRMTLCCKID